MQIQHYNTVFPDIKKSDHTWCCVFDLDEFLVIDDPTLTIPEYCKQMMVDGISELSIQWKVFGSSGFIQQPKSIRTSFIHRDPMIYSCKGIVRICDTINLNIHEHAHRGRRVIVSKAFLNHYCIQSWEWFEKVKMTRGAADVLYNVRNQDYFRNADGAATLEDTLLKDRCIRNTK
jgi:Glycosyltransferase family 92